VALID